MSWPHSQRKWTRTENRCFASFYLKVIFDVA
jgi:hypothetical protein